MFPSFSWLPSLPSIDFTLPSSIQKRFISFALRQSLGHLLKPGQLDVQQVDSQIGSGYVQVRDLELNNEAINAMISGLPIRLHDGSVGKVTARIPWPNPLTSSVGLSLESLHLTFYLEPSVAPPSQRAFADNLAESVASVAETFIHEELTPNEEATLRESIHPDHSSSSTFDDHVPGGLDPFISEDEVHFHEADPPGVSLFATLIERLLARFQFDATDTRITIVNPQQASFTLIVPEVRYGTEAQEMATTGEPSSPSVDPRATGETRKVTITGVTVTTRCLRPESPKPLSPHSPAEVQAPRTASPSTPMSAAPEHSSDMDEDTQLLMSQSIAALPPRPVSPASSVASSMYQSAISMDETDVKLDDIPEEDSIHSRSATPPCESPEHLSPSASLTGSALQEHLIEDETILSLGSEPIELRLTTPPPFRPAPAPRQPSMPPSSHSPEAKTTRTKVDTAQLRQDKLRVDLSIGTVALAFSARQLRAIIDIADLWTSHSVPIARSTAPRHTDAAGSPLPFDDIEGAVRIRGVVILLLSSARSSAANPDDVLTEYFSRPLVPPRLPVGYTRIHVENISSSLSMKRPELAKGRPTTSQRESPSVSVSLSITEMSAFAFLPRTGQEMTASPLLITDPHLPSQYLVAHMHPSPTTTSEPSSLLPTFDIIDWTDPTQQSVSAKLSLWRTKPPQHPPAARSPSRSGNDDTRFPSPIPTSPPRRGADLPKPSSPPSAQGRDAAEVHVTLAPLHFFLDTGMILGRKEDGKSEVLRFVEELTAASSPPRPDDPAAPVSEEHIFDDHDMDYDEHPGTPRVSALRGLPDHETEQERERRRLEQLVLEDLQLGYDYRGHGQSRVQTTPTSRRSGVSYTVLRKRTKAQGPAISVVVPAIRIQIRTPPPADRSPRAGAVIVDLHDLRLSPGAAPQQEVVRNARFGTAEDLYGADAPSQSLGHDNVVLGAIWKRIVVSYSVVGESKARAILSLGPLSQRDPDQGAQFGVGTPPARESSTQSLRPQLIARKSPAASHSSATPSVTSTTVSIDLPSIHVELSKPLLDGLQLWADDLTQLAEAAFAEPAGSDTSTQRGGSGDSSLIGSRYFARTSTVGSGTDSGGTSLANTMRPRQEQRSEIAVKIAVTEAVLRLLVPRGEGSQAVVRAFDVTVSDVDVLLELKPEGKDETVVTVGITDLTVHDTTPSGKNCFLSLTTPRSLSTSARSALKLRFTSLVVPETTAKESRIRLTVHGITYNFYPDIAWATDLGRFFKAPPGAFESVVPSERTRVNVKINDTSIRLFAPTHKGALLPYIGELEFSTVIEGNSPQKAMNLSLSSFTLLLIDELTSNAEESGTPARTSASQGVAFWKGAGYAVITELSDLVLSFKQDSSVKPPDGRLFINNGHLRIHMCADTMGTLGAFIGDLSSAFKSPNTGSVEPKRKREPANVSEKSASSRSLLASLDEQAFRRLPEVGAAPDMIEDDLPTNPDYLDEHFGAAAGLREFSDDEFEESDPDSPSVVPEAERPQGATSAYGGETVRILRPEGLHIVEDYFDTLPPDPGEAASFGDTTFQVRVQQFHATLLLYDGYDWVRTRKIIEEKAKEMRRKLAKIRQLVANGQTPDPSVEETNALLFNSVYIGLEHNVDELEPGALIAAIDEELNEEFETNTQSSWQSLKPQPLASPGRSNSNMSSRHRRRLHRSKGPSIEIRLIHVDAEVDQYRPEAALVSRVFATVKDLEILDHIKTSTWRKFLTSLRADSRGNVRETDSNMVRVELRMLHPVPGHPSQEARLRAKILPLRLHVDQDALDFLKQFFAFKDPDAAPPAPSESADEIYFQQAEVFPVDIKLDYKPRRVDYRALREGRTIELMNFFHFDGAEMTLRHITVKGITGWPKFFDLLNDLWTPDVKATQLVEVISGVAPIRSVVNVGSGVADLVLLPIAQYKKDGRVYRGLQKGTNAFMKSTAMEAIKLGARLATGTQVILEQAETVLGGQFKDEVMAEALQVPMPVDLDDGELDEDTADLISKYAEQPVNVKEGVQSAYRSLKRNLNSAAQTILAVPMEVYERSGNEGAVRAVVRAVPIAVLKPMIGATEAVSKTLLGLQNTLDPNIRQENEAKYKQR
ncbi:hypothetical protein C8Q76DRAFT_654887 [Earliella scabrosa]|nr:hypothetical protein C8Q76DRAFT_654887 [Earliella scabrosa]